MKILKKITCLCISIFMMSFQLFPIFAADAKTELAIVQASAVKQMENKQGNVSQTIVDFNKDAGEATIELKVNNQNSRARSKYGI